MSTLEVSITQKCQRPFDTKCQRGPETRQIYLKRLPVIKIWIIFATVEQNLCYMKNIFRLMLLSLFSVAFVACSDSDDYNADTAVTPYEPVPGRRMVAQIKTTNTINGRDYSWEHNFVYDAQGRIKEINSNIVHYRAYEFDNVTRFYKCNITSQANYYFRGNDFSVEYTASKEYPDYPDWNTRENGKNNGQFKENGTLASFLSLDFVYSAMQLKEAHADGGSVYVPCRDALGNVTGYQKRAHNNNGNDSIVFDRSKDFIYSGIKNKTNFDFSGYFGYWGLERAVPAIATEYYAYYQLTAFGMMGSTSSYLPLAQLSRDNKGNPLVDESGAPLYLYGKWEFDSRDYPISFIDGSGRKTEIRYVE